MCPAPMDAAVRRDVAAAAAAARGAVAVDAVPAATEHRDVARLPARARR